MSTRPRTDFSPFLSPAQLAAAQRADYPPVPKRCVVTGGTGFVGARLVEMLIERGAERVVSFDIVPREKLKYPTWDHPAIVYQTGDITNVADVEKACEGADCVWHIAAAVGPFHPQEVYNRVNYGGTVNVINACKKFKVPKLVMSSSPSTRFKGSLWSRPDYDGVTEAAMPKLPLESYMAEYAATKALGEMAVTAACCDELLTVNVAPHQVYGPRDNLFMPNMLETIMANKLRVFADGLNRICFTHVDNYSHALIIAERQLVKGNPVLGKFYIATDGRTHPGGNQYAVFWKELDKIASAVGVPSLWSKFHLPFWLLYSVALVCEAYTAVTGVTTKLNVFNVFVLTMNRWFDIAAIEKDMAYEPIIGFERGWADTIKWFVDNWVPEYRKKLAAGGDSWGGIAAQSQDKIDTQAKSVLKS